MGTTYKRGCSNHSGQKMFKAHGVFLEVIKWEQPKSKPQRQTR
jgi:hypothetical protein